MKKAFVAVLVALMVSAAVFAATEPVVKYDDIDFTFQPSLARYDAMGQSGLALMSRLDSFYTNPAALADGGFKIAVPSVSFSFYNIQKMVSDPEAVDIINRLVKGEPHDDDQVNLAAKYLSALGTGRNMVAKADVGLLVKVGVLGLGGNIQVKLHSLSNGSSAASQNIIPEVNLAQTVAVGLKFIETDKLTLSAGVSGHFIYKAYMKGINGGKAIQLVGNSDKMEETIMWNTPVMGGFAVPFDAGVTLGLLNDQMTISATANNLNGVYHMKSYSSGGDLVNSIFKDKLTAPEDHVSADSEEFEVITPWTMNFGFAFAPDVPVLNPVLTADLIDMFELVKSFGSDSFRASDLLLHLNVGAEIGVADIFTLKAGVNRGYMSVGAGLNLFFARLDVAYGWQEFGVEIGDKPVDSLTVKFSLGYDK